MQPQPMRKLTVIGVPGATYWKDVVIPESMYESLQAMPRQQALGWLLTLTRESAWNSTGNLWYIAPVDYTAEEGSVFQKRREVLAGLGDGELPGWTD